MTNDDWQAAATIMRKLQSDIQALHKKEALLDELKAFYPRPAKHELVPAVLAAIPQKKGIAVRDLIEMMNGGPARTRDAVSMSVRAAVKRLLAKKEIRRISRGRYARAS